MFICHEKIDPTVSVENTFVARDDSEQIVGVCTVSPRHMTLFPDCPEQYVVCAMGDAAQSSAFQLVHELRQMGVSAERDTLFRSVKAQMKYADKLGARYTLVIGDEELKNGKANLRDMATGEQKEIELTAGAIARVIG